MSRTSNRRDFLKTAAAGAAVSLSAASYAKVKGANDRINIAMIGCGSRGRGAHMTGVHAHDKKENVEFIAVCDPWRQQREAAAALVKDWYGRDARQCVSYRDILEMDDVDAVMIASCDHQHTTHLEAVAKAKKDVYCEKPLAMDFDKLKKACDAVKESGIVAQIGTQLRSYPSFNGAREVFRTGVLGTVGRIEQRRNGHRPYWYSRLAKVSRDDVDWEEFLMDAPDQPFREDVFSGWYGYRDFSDGSVPGLGSHFIDLVHYITGAKYPESAVCLGGTFTWKDEHNFTCPDHVQTEWIYPEGFMVSYATNFGNGSGNSFKLYGNEAVMDLVDWNKPKLIRTGTGKPGEKAGEAEAIRDVPMPDHVLDWLQCLRTRKTPNADIEAGYQHAVAVIMSMRAYDTGKRQVYDAGKRLIHEG
jgi:predicted dehydrogenase